MRPSPKAVLLMTHDRAAGTEILDALAGLLALEQLPVSALWAAGYLLLQLAAFGRGGAELTRLQAQNVQHAWGRSRDGIMDQMRGACATAEQGL